MKKKVAFFAPLINFESDAMKIGLDKGTSIRRASEAERRIQGVLSTRLLGVTSEEYVLECAWVEEADKVDAHENLEKARDCIEKTLTLLRLYREEIIGFNLILPVKKEFEPYTFPLPTFHLRHYQLWVHRTSEFFRRKYRVGRKEARSLRKFFCKYKLNTMMQLDPAIRYFNRSYIEPYTPHTSLLDLMISLENLYLRGETLELGYKLRMRMASLLGKTPKERTDIMNNVKRAYRDRGQIVHGEKLPKANYQLLFKVRAYLRESLKKFIQDPKLGDRLDDVILS